jgi:hypothetical protein
MRLIAEFGTFACTNACWCPLVLTMCSNEPNVRYGAKADLMARK